MSSQLLKASSDALQEMYPKHIDTIRAGLLLAVCGRVKHTDNGKWDVKGQESHNGQTYTYHVIDGFIWTCDCQNFKNGVAQNIDFLGTTARHLCKHVAAVAICRGAMLNGCYPEPEPNVYNTLSNIVAAQHIPSPGEAWQLPGIPLKLVRKDRDGHDVVMLATGRQYSQPLVTWVSNPALPGRGMWHLHQDAFERYCKFIEEAFGVKVQRQEWQATL